MGSPVFRFSTVAYTHGGGLDAPLSLVRKGLLTGVVTIVPHSNWRGQYHAGSYTDGAVAGNSRLDLREVRWPAENAGAYLNPLRPFRRDAPWMGSLVQSSEDASGLITAAMELRSEDGAVYTGKSD